MIKGLLARGAPAGADEARAAGSTGCTRIHRALLETEWEPTTDGINFAAVVCEVDKHLAPTTRW